LEDAKDVFVQSPSREDTFEKLELEVLREGRHVVARQR
jgi:hypothetical protein